MGLLVVGGALLLAPLPLPLAGLGVLSYLAGAVVWPLGGLGGAVATLPFYLFARQLGGQAVSPTEATLLLAALGIGARAIWDRHRAAVKHRDGSTGRVGEGITAPSGVKGAASRASTGEDRAGARSDERSDRTVSGDWRRFDRPVVLFLAAGLLSLLATEYLRLSLRELRTMIVEPTLFFFLVRAVVRSPAEARRLVDVLALVTTVVATLAVAQFFLGGAVTDVQGVRRVHGTYTSPNHLALLLGRTIPFLLALAWLVPRCRLVRLGAATLCGLALLLSFSVGGWLGTGLAVLLVVGLLGGRRPVAALLVAGVLVVAVVLAVAPVERLAGRFDPTRGTALVRVQLWRAAVELIRERPLLGIGLDNFLYRYAELLPPTTGMEPNLSHPHNLLLQVWLQLGLLGVVALGWLLVAAVRALWPHVGVTAPPAQRALAVGALGSLVDFVAHGAVDNSYFLMDTAFIFWLTLAIASAVPSSRPAPDCPFPSGVQSPSAAPT